ncbi:MAG: 2-C-methyl-D-erythritol 2,4-cyclodiphosphate synthase [Phycisphaerales bacterium]|nr:MAG: 2-C-methyl-D-erythritol 2,4-cyclodiphosphate synthase [Phycisphaerales bacterium]
MSANCPWRVGIGYDIHRLADGVRLKLGGVEIDHPRGLAGHSDGDAVLHAIADAFLGAAGQPDIGEQFPDTDPAYEGKDSCELLGAVVRRINAAGFVPVNVDCIVHAEEPRISPHKRRMADTIAGLVGLPAGAVSVKATTHEGLGPIGGRQGIACTATVLLARRGDQAGND